MCSQEKSSEDGKRSWAGRDRTETVGACLSSVLATRPPRGRETVGLSIFALEEEARAHADGGEAVPGRELEVRTLVLVFLRSVGSITYVCQEIGEIHRAKRVTRLMTNERTDSGVKYMIARRPHPRPQVMGCGMFDVGCEMVSM